MSPWYRTEPKQLVPMTEEQFINGMEHGLFLKPTHRAYNILLYYSLLRKQEALRLVKENFQKAKNKLYVTVEFPVEQTRRIKTVTGWDREKTGRIVKERLKHSDTTPPLPLQLKAPYMNILLDVVEQTKPTEKVFPFSPKTAYNVVHRVYKYPHYFRLSGITNLFEKGFTIAQVHSWTGLTLGALNSYIGLVDVEKMGKSLAKR
jgi:hypothetical protein